MKRKNCAIDPARPADQTADRSAQAAAPQHLDATQRLVRQQTARQRGRQTAQDAVRAMGPRLDDGYLRLNPVLVSARGRINDQLAPRLGGAWQVASASPVVVEATKRGRAALAAARGELSLPAVTTRKQGSRPKRLTVIAAATGAAGAAAVMAKKWLGLKKAEQQEAPSTTSEAPTVPSPSPSAPGTPTAPSDTPEAIVPEVTPNATLPPVSNGEKSTTDPIGGAA